MRPRFARQALIGILVLGAPLGLVRLLTSLQTSIPRFALDQFDGERAVGIFAALAYLIVIGNRFVLSLSQSMAPRLAAYHIARSGSAFRRLYAFLLGVALFLGVVGSSAAFGFGEWILELLYGPAYAAHLTSFHWIMLAAAIGYVRIVMEYAMIATRWIRVQVPLLAISTLVLTVAAYGWVPEHGILGGAWALVAAGSVEFLGSLAVNVAILRNSFTAQPVEEDR